MATNLEAMASNLMAIVSNLLPHGLSEKLGSPGMAGVLSLTHCISLKESQDPRIQ